MTNPSDTLEPPEPADGVLIRQHLDGDPNAGDDLIRRHSTSLYRFIYGMLRNPADTEDVCQQTFTQAFAALPTYRDQGKFRAWLFRIGRNQALGLIRKRKRRPESARPVEAFDAAPHDTRQNVESNDAIAGIHHAIGQLPEGERTVLELRLREGLTFREIAELSEAPLGTVLSRMKTAREKLRDLLSPILDEQFTSYLKS